MDIFKLYRYFWDFAFSNPELIRANYCAVFSFSIEHCYRLGWKEKFGFPFILLKNIYLWLIFAIKASTS